jgi:F1F0 ATPase subunit 2
MMNELLALAAGAALGLIFFGGLWWTVRRAAASPAPALWFFASLMLRMSVVLWGFHVAGGGHWQRMLAALLGFSVARVVVARWTRPPPAGPGQPPTGARHAP